MNSKQVTQYKRNISSGGADFKNGRTSCALNNYIPLPVSELTANSLIPIIEELLCNEIDIINRQERIIASCSRAGRPSLYVRKTKGTAFYSLKYPDTKDKAGTKEIYITRKRDQILHYLNLELADNTIAEHRNNRDLLQSLITSLKARQADHAASKQVSSFNNKVNTLPLRGILPEFLLWPEDKIKWALKEYTTNPYYLEDLQYQCKSGLWVRTKAEEKIANALAEHHLLFRYEPALCFNGITKYPDFVIWTNAGKIIIWEHRGAQHINSYRANEGALINWYEQQGFSRLSSLIVTHESDIQTASQIEGIIKTFILT